MAESDNEDRTEEASDERREEFRARGEVALSPEVTQVFVMASIMVLLGTYLVKLSTKLQLIMREYFESFDTSKMNQKWLLLHLGHVGEEFLWMIVPFFAVASITATAITFGQTRLNWSWERLAPDFTRLNPFPGLMRMVSMDAWVTVLKSTAKMVIIIAISFAILKGEFGNSPGLMNMPFLEIWNYWASISHTLFWSVLGLLLFIAAADFIYNFLTLEKRMKMTKEEVKEEYKKRELDPHLKSKMKRMQREIANSKTVQATKTATVVITNPTHFAVALRYELGMSAPVVVAKGQDFTAQRMKEVAKENGILIMENKPLARTLFKVCKVGQEIPESLYKAVSEIIRYVFMMKGKSLSRPRT